MHLFIADIREFREGEGLFLLSEERQRRALRYFHAKDRARSIVAGLLLRYLYGAAALAIQFGKWGKPFLAGAELESPHFSLSHSGDYVAVLAGEWPCGVDVEEAKPGRDFCALARRAASADESALLEEENFRLDVFYQIWAAKESVMKATGMGLAMDARSFSVLPLTSGSRRILDREWNLAWYALNGYSLAIASDPRDAALGNPTLAALGKSSLLG